MATSFLAALGAVPWGTVIERAPDLINQGSKLLASMRGKRPEAPLPTAGDAESLRERVSAQAAEIEALRSDLTQASALIVELSRDQATLIAEVRKLRRWCVGIGSAALLALLGLALLAIR